MNQDDVNTSGVGDLVEAIRRGAGGLKDEALEAIERMRDAYERARMRRALYLAAFLGGIYLVARRKK